MYSLKYKASIMYEKGKAYLLNSKYNNHKKIKLSNKIHEKSKTVYQANVLLNSFFHIAKIFKFMSDKNLQCNYGRLVYKTKILIRFVKKIKFNSEKLQKFVQNICVKY